MITGEKLELPHNLKAPSYARNINDAREMCMFDINTLKMVVRWDLKKDGKWFAIDVEVPFDKGDNETNEEYMKRIMSFAEKRQKTVMFEFIGLFEANK